jgi:peptidoglycan/xylan/chitin deacetylase (PgdA/CDA1 family)
MPAPTGQTYASAALQSLHFLYHELRTEDSKYSYVLGTDEFEQQMDFFARRQAERGQGIRPEITFDDGHISNYQLALPILQARGIKARLFITVGWTGHKPGYMGWEELRSLHEAGQEIGAHGWSHTLLTHCDSNTLATELGRARLTLEDKLGASITTMSLPGGRYNNRVIAACFESGYTQIYTSEPKVEPIPAGTLVGRLNVLKGMKGDWISSLLEPDSTALKKMGQQYRVKAMAKNVLGDRMYEKVWALVNRKEIDSQQAEAAGE